MYTKSQKIYYIKAESQKSLYNKNDLITILKTDGFHQSFFSNFEP